jgi:hypothetical protein
MAARCPSDLALEHHLLAPERSPVADHLAACPACATRLESMRRQGDEFLQYVFPATVEAVQDAAEAGPARRLAWPRWLAVVPALGAATALVVFLARPAAPPPDYLGMKGSGELGLSVFVQEGTGPRLARDGAAVAGGAALRFRVRAGRPCHLWLLSVDARGQVSRLHPTRGDGGAAVEQTVDLPGGAVLDGQAGPERILAVCAPAPVAWASTEAAARAAFGAGGADTVRRASRLTGLPAGTVQDSLLLEKLAPDAPRQERTP